MNKRRNHNLKIEKGLNPFQSVIIFFLGLLYYYGLACIAMIVLAIIVVVLTGNIELVIDTYLTDVLPMIIGAIIWYPTYLLQKYLLKYWKQLQSK